MDDVKSPNENAPHKMPPHLSAEERRAIWHQAQALLKDHAQEMLAELEQSRAEWDR